MISEIWRVTDIIFFFFMVSFSPFYHTNMPGYQSFYHYAYTVPDIMEHDGCNCYFSLWAIFCSLYIRYHHFTHVYGSLDMVHDRQMEKVTQSWVHT